jgi:putative membrane protein
MRHAGKTGASMLKAVAAGYGAVQYGMNHEAAPAPPSTPSAKTTIVMTALAGRLNARPPWKMDLDMVPSLSSSSDPSAVGYVHNVTIVAQSVMRVTNTIFLRGHPRLQIPPPRRALGARRTNVLSAIGMSKMIKNFGDHSSNERTFLAWVRTAIAVMAFGFIVEKFDLFLEVAAPSLAGRTPSVPGQRIGNIAGLALIIVGTAMVVIAAIRFLITAKNIDSEDLKPGAGSRMDVALAVLLVLLGSALFLYLSHALVTTQ